MTCKQLYDVYVIPVADAGMLAGPRHFQGRMTLEAIRQFTGSATPALDRIVRESEAKPYAGVSLHGCPRVGTSRIVAVFKVTERSSVLRHVFWTSDLTKTA